MPYGFNNDKSKYAIETTVTEISTSNEIGTIEANNYGNILFDIEDIVASFDEVIGVREFQFGNSNNIIYSLLPCRIVFDEVSSRKQCRIYVYNPTSSNIQFQKANTKIKLVTYKK